MLPRAPLFSQPPAGTPAQQYMHRARMFRQAAMGLSAYSNGEQFLPKYALLTHAIELALKAFALHSVPPSVKMPSNHDLRGWYDLALAHGLSRNHEVSENIDHMQQLHFTHYTRYPQEPAGPVPDLSNIADDTANYLIAEFTRVINPR
jgi:hypothetical protein